MKYFQVGNEAFASYLKSEYVDKTDIISVINQTLGTERRYTCVTRCRRFGKSMAANTLCAYYDKSCDSHSLFAALNIAKDPDYEKHINKYPVIKLDITDFTTQFRNDKDIVGRMQQALKEELAEAYSEAQEDAEADFMSVLTTIAEKTGDRFIMVIDEWDAIFREFSSHTLVTDEYIDWLRRMFKGGNSLKVFAGVYMTGILPIKKYKTESALNNFREYSMVQPQRLAGSFGFTASEVAHLCEKHGMDFDEMAKWYDGYKIGSEPSVFNPYSVMEAIAAGECDSYFSKTGSYTALTHFIQMDYEGLKNDIINMLCGGRCPVNTTKFQNDLSVINSKDDVFTALIHLGYLAYDRTDKQCYVPNKEVAGELANAIEDCGWSNVAKSIDASNHLLRATLEGDSDFVAKGISQAHDEHTSILSYNDENSLACVLRLAYYTATNDFILHSELGTGKGYADIVLVPRKHVDKPAIVIELKYNKSAQAAIDQIRQKNYPAKVAEYTGNLLLVGINYDKKTKVHTCIIEKVTKDLTKESPKSKI